MPVQHVNRRGVTYYLHQGRTKTSKQRWFFSTKPEGELSESVPEGYEIYENPNAQVFLRKKLPRLITDDEVALVERGVRDLARQKHFQVDVKSKDIIVHLPGQDDDVEERFLGRLGLPPTWRPPAATYDRRTYMPMMKFTLVDEETRRFCACRWCFLGSIDDWFPLAGSGDLSNLVQKYAPHLGKQSFFELM
jgi:hypothetical protein